MDVLRKSLLFVSVPLVLLVVVGTIRARVDESHDQVLRDLKVFSEALYLINNYYVEDVPLGQLERGAFHGLAESLDPWSSYWDPARMAKLTARDEAGDVGLFLVKTRQSYVAVASVVKGSPADLAGVRHGQFLETIEGLATKDLTLLEAQHMLRGPVGSSVEVGYFRQSADADAGMSLSLERADLSELLVVVERPSEGVALLRVGALTAGVAEAAAEQLRTLSAAGVKKLVLDLRSNAGGTREQALALADLFVDARPVFSERGRGGTTVFSTVGPAVWVGEMVVLVGRGTVGEAELVARALRDAGAGTLLGQPTFGKRSRQELVRLTDGSGLHLTVAEYLTAEGEPLEEAGVRPDEEVAPPPSSVVDEEGAEEEAPETVEQPDPGSTADPQLERALEILAGEPVRKAA